MKISLRATLIVLAASAVFVGVPRASYAGCNQTLSAGSSVAQAVASVPNGTTWTICLQNGVYSGSSATFANITRTSGVVTIQSASGVGATIQGSGSPNITNSDYLTFTNLTLDRIYINGCSTNITISNSVFVNQALGGVFVSDGGSCGAQNIVIDNVDFRTVQVTAFNNHGQFGTEGSGPNGINVRNSRFGQLAGTNPGDGMHLGGGINHVIGPGNIFDSIRQSYCDSTNLNHCDGIQIYGGGAGATITGNWFTNVDTPFMAPDSDSKSGLRLVNNVFDESFGGNGSQPVQCGSCTNTTFRHNTVIIGANNSTGVNFDSKTGNPASSNVLVEDNIFINTGIDVLGGSGCVTCTVQYNLFTVSGDVTPGSTKVVSVNNIVATPVFVGGSRPTTWAGWQLTTASPGHNAGNDGLDMGTLYYGGTSGTTTGAPAAPTNLRISELLIGGQVPGKASPFLASRIGRGRV